jgi:hypothetical protein
MLGSGKTRAVRVFVTAGWPRNRDAAHCRWCAAAPFRWRRHQLPPCPAGQVRCPEQRPRVRPADSLRPVRSGGAVASYPRDMAARWHQATRSLVSWPVAVAVTGGQASTSAAGSP